MRKESTPNQQAPKMGEASRTIDTCEILESGQETPENTMGRNTAVI